jgi:prepilin-type N-terminal cleavage/methylation domain-containing protein/prepilin-type processing-associated H-X9-DG protein
MKERTGIEQPTERCRKRKPTGFTLIELLITVGIIAILASLMLPMLARAKARARCVVCAGNLRQMGIGTELYTLDNQDRLPGCQHSLPSWKYGLASYSGTNVYVCPDDAATRAALPEARRNYSCVINDFLTPNPYGARMMDYSKKTSVPGPSETMLFGEAATDYLGLDHFHFADALENGFTTTRFAEQVEVRRHGSAANYLIVDGHVETLNWEKKVKPLLNSPSRFVDPEGKAGADYAAGQ